MSNLRKYFFKYFGNYELPVIPLSGKRPIIKDWSKYCSQMPTEEEVDSWNTDNNIGLCLGPESGIIALDIDTDDKETLKRCPISPVVKRGKKGETRFFKYNKEEAIKRHDLAIELLSLGNQTVIPPSIHPETKTPYVFTSLDLFPDRWDELPDLDKDFYQYLLKRDGETRTSEIIPSDGSRCNHNSYNKISEMLVAALYSDKTPEMIVEELLEYDSVINQEVSLFVCPSQKWKGYDRVSNCFYFVLDAFKRHKTSIMFQKTPEIKITQNEGPGIDYKRKKLPKLRGVMQEMFEYMYNNSPVPRTRFCVASAITTMSVLVGNKVRYNSIHPNLYTMILAPSGYGKDFSMKFPSKLLSKSKRNHLIGEGRPISDSAIIANLPERRVRIDVVDEAATLFNAINDKKNTFSSAMSDVYAALYTSTGDYFPGKNAMKYKTASNSRGNIGECWSPYVSMLCAMTIKDFKNVFSQDTMDKGLGGRFLYFADDEKKRPNYSVEQDSIPPALLDFVDKLDPPTDKIDFSDPTKEFYIHDIIATTQAKEIMRAFGEELEDDKHKWHEKLMPVHNRLYVNFVKLAILDAVSVGISEGISKIKITVESAKWAKSFVKACLNSMEDFLSLNVVENSRERVINDFEEEVLRAGSEGIQKEVFSKKYNIKKYGMLKNQRDAILNTLICDKIVFIVGKGKKTLYIHSNFVGDEEISL